MNVLETLVSLFTQRLAKVEQETEHNVFSAYLAFFIGSLTKGNPTIRETLRSYLPSNSFVDVIQILKEFVEFHKIIEASNEAVC